jgi:hypothetical protein
MEIVLPSVVMPVHPGLSVHDRCVRYDGYDSYDGFKERVDAYQLLI